MSTSGGVRGRSREAPPTRMCARQGALLGSESLPWTLSRGTTHLSQGVRREAESEGAYDEIRIRRTETGS